MDKVSCLKQFICAVEHVDESQIEESDVVGVLSRFFTDISNQEIKGETICEVLHKVIPLIPDLYASISEGQLLAQVSSGTLTEIETSSIKNIKEYFFSKCQSLRKVILPECTGMGSYAFQHCYNLNTISMPKQRTVGANAFYRCTNLTIVDFPSCTGAYAYAFDGCNALEKISLGNCGNIGMNAFNDCKKLKTLILGGAEVVSLGNDAFANTPILTSETEGFIYVKDELVETYKAHAKWSVYANKIKGLSELPSEESDE